MPRHASVAHTLYSWLEMNHGTPLTATPATRLVQRIDLCVGHEARSTRALDGDEERLLRTLTTMLLSSAMRALFAADESCFDPLLDALAYRWQGSNMRGTLAGSVLHVTDFADLFSRAGSADSALLLLQHFVLAHCWNAAHDDVVAEILLRAAQACAATRALLKSLAVQGEGDAHRAAWQRTACALLGAVPVGMGLLSPLLEKLSPFFADADVMLRLPIDGITERPAEYLHAASLRTDSNDIVVAFAAIARKEGWWHEQAGHGTGHARDYLALLMAHASPLSVAACVLADPQWLGNTAQLSSCAHAFVNHEDAALMPFWALVYRSALERALSAPCSGSFATLSLLVGPYMRVAMPPYARMHASNRRAVAMRPSHHDGLCFLYERGARRAALMFCGAQAAAEAALAAMDSHTRLCDKSRYHFFLPPGDAPGFDAFVRRLIQNAAAFEGYVLRYDGRDSAQHSAACALEEAAAAAAAPPDDIRKLRPRRGRAREAAVL